MLHVMTGAVGECEVVTCYGRDHVIPFLSPKIFVDCVRQEDMRYVFTCNGSR